MKSVSGTVCVCLAPLFGYKNNNITPAMEMNAPNISLGKFFSLKIIIEAGIIIIGDMDVMDETMPAAVCCSATSERTTPI